MGNSTQKDRSFAEDIVNKVGGFILKQTTTGGAGKAKANVDNRMQTLDDVNQALDNSSPQDTPAIQKIFEK